MFMTAARTLADSTTDVDLARGSVFPPLDRIREVSTSIATAVATVAYAHALASEPEPTDLRAFIERLMYVPAY